MILFASARLFAAALIAAWSVSFCRLTGADWAAVLGRAKRLGRGGGKRCILDE